MDKFRAVKRVLWLILFANIAVAAAKILLGTAIGSASVTADGYHSLTDGTSNIVGLIGIGIAAMPVDEDHPYGHRKYETLTALFIVVMLCLLGFRILTEAMARFSAPAAPEVSFLSLLLMFVTLVINIFVTRYENRKGRELGSAILISDAAHTRSDIYVTLGVIGALTAIRLGAPPIVDPLASIVVAGFILHAAYEIYRDASNVLVDGAAISVDRIKAIALAQPGVLGVHKIRSRGTADDVHIDMHILARPCMSLEESHQLVHSVEDALKENLGDTVQTIVHMEPYKEPS